MVLYFRFSDDGKPEFRGRRRVDGVLTTLGMPRRFARENFTSGRRRHPISSSMLKVPIRERIPICLRLIGEQIAINFEEKDS